MDSNLRSDEVFMESNENTFIICKTISKSRIWVIGSSQFKRLFINGNNRAASKFNSKIFDNSLNLSKDQFS